MTTTPTQQRVRVIKVYATFNVSADLDLDGIGKRVRNVVPIGPNLIAYQNGRVFIFRRNKVSVCFVPGPEDVDVQPIDYLASLRSTINVAMSSVNSALSQKGKIDVVVMKTVFNFQSLADSLLKIDILHQRIADIRPDGIVFNILEPTLADKLLVKFSAWGDGFSLVFHINESGETFVHYDLRKCHRPLPHARYTERVGQIQSLLESYLV